MAKTKEKVWNITLFKKETNYRQNHPNIPIIGIQICGGFVLDSIQIIELLFLYTLLFFYNKLVIISIYK